MVRPMLDCGVISKETGQWEGIATTDNQMLGLTTNLSVANGGDILVPNTDSYPSIDMTGYTGLFVAIKATEAGNYKMTAVMGPDTVGRWGLYPVDAASTLRLANGNPSTSNGAFAKALEDDAEVLTANVWEVFAIQDRLAGQKNLQFKIINNSGSTSDVEFAFLRRV